MTFQTANSKVPRDDLNVRVSTFWEVFHALERDLELEGVPKGTRVVQDRYI